MARSPSDGGTGDAGIVLLGPLEPGFDLIITPDALRFLAMLHRRHDQRRRGLLRRREGRQRQLDAGAFPDFNPDTAPIRAGSWRVEPLPDELLDRRVEITGPVERRMILHALNSGASAFMADFEDATSPTWVNLVSGQVHLYHAVRRTLEDRQSGAPPLTLAEKPAVLLVRPRGWHLPEAHLEIDGRPISGALFDFGLFLFHNARELVRRGSGPYFYLPKLEDHREARLWNEVFIRAQRALKLPVGTIKATVLIETVLAAFEMDEILFALREHAAGLNCGRWDYIFSVIKKFRRHPRFVLPDRAQVTMERHFLRSYTRLVVQTCHRRGALAIGGMAAQIPIKADPAAHELAMERVRADKRREVGDGHDGTWVAHPALVAPVREIFDAAMPGPNQIDRRLEEVTITAADLLTMPEGQVTEAGVRSNLSVAVTYLANWLGGRGCVPLHNLMEDAATAEIARAQVWQWVHFGAPLEDGRPLNASRLRSLRRSELKALRKSVGEARWESGHYDRAVAILDRLIRARTFPPFMTLPAYDELLNLETSDTPVLP
ncbi:MAG TPA: malate synthase A [Gemmatimonadales bacterium]|nr:malate synthase A [Gemmatimonadales bacterium]